MCLINTLTNYLKRFLGARLQDTDFSTFVPAVPLTRKQQLIEECQKQNVSIYIDDLFERSAIFRSVASEAELERRLNTKKAIALSERANTLSRCANFIALLALIASAIPFVKSLLWGIAYAET